MSYQVLARKWRPKNFEELMGQEHVVTVLVNALAQQRLHHAYLFTGTRGVGKTTIARIFAKSLNCETGITATPCGKCDTCLEIDQGRFIDLLEIDAASKTKVDDTREILDNVQYAPTRGRYKVYLIDEVHMLSRHSFNALLKTLEEPPEHVKFILATTDPQKLPITVLSRCLQFHLKALTVKQIEEKLQQILVQEQVTHEQGSLRLLSKAARGSMRDSLSLTDQAIAQGQGNITVANIQQMLGGIDQNWVYKIVLSLLKQDGVNLMALTQEIASFAPSYSRLFAELIQLFHQIAILQIIDQHFDLPPEHVQLLKSFSQAMSGEDVQLYYQICVNGRKDLPYASDEQAAFDMTILRLFAFKPMIKAQLSAESVIQQTTSTAPLLDISIALDESSDNSINLPEEHQLASEMLALEQQAQLLQTDSKKSQESNEPSIQKNSTFENSAVEIPAIESPIVTNELTLLELESPVTAVLASRNMLRSRKKQLEQQVKKPNDAIARQKPINFSKQQFIEEINTLEKPANKIKIVEKANKKEILPVPQKAYQANNIDPATIHKANQVDQWAHMIDSMKLTTRLRQLAIHATISEKSTKDNLILQLDQASKHLHTKNAQQQLQENLSLLLSHNVVVTIEVVNKTVADPYQIQSHINDRRLNYAKEVLEKDDIVQALQQNFQAQLDEQSISVI